MGGSGYADFMEICPAYDHPRYYEIGFSYRNLESEVRVMAEAMQRFSTVPVSRVLECACGPAPHLAEIARRDWSYTGLDLNENMLAYARRKAEELDVEATFVAADMAAFSMPEPVDLACTMLGSIYVQSTDALLGHLRSVAAALRPGGLYFLDSCVDLEPMGDISEAWEAERDGVRVRVAYFTRHVDRIAQLREERLRMEVDDDGAHSVIEGTSVKRCIYPQEFLWMVAHQTEFEFVGWWNDWDLNQPLSEAEYISRPITILRRKGE
jgi:SAM-dependent methyltransferase